MKNKIINDEENHDIPDFWDECYEKDLYDLCTPTVEGKDTFTYGIGVIVDEDCISEMWIPVKK